METKELSAIIQSLKIMAFLFISTFFLFFWGIQYQYQFLQRLINRAIIRPIELEAEIYSRSSSGTSRRLVAVGYIDSIKVSMTVRKNYLVKTKGEKRTVPVWYNPVCEEIFYRGLKDNGTKFSMTIWSWYYFKAFVFLILPHLFLSRAFYRRYKEYKKLKNEIKTKK